MPDDDTSRRGASIQRILERTLFPLTDWPKPLHPPILGEDYAAILSGLESRRQEMIENLRTAIMALTPESLLVGYDEDGRATDPDVRKKQLELGETARRLSENQRPWYAAGLGRKDLLADYRHWSASAYFDVREAVLLSVGLEPAAAFDELLADNPRPKERVREEDSLPAVFLKRRFDLFKREFDPNRFRQRVLAVDLQKWVLSVTIDVHPGFQQMLSEMVERERQEQIQTVLPSVEASIDDRKPDARETATLSKLLLAIAITEYGYVPEAKRSPIPKQIRDIVQLLGMDISEETIRKYLQTGRTYLPKDWKPNP